MQDDKKVAELIDQIIKRMDMLISDTSVPKNVRGAISQAKTNLSSNQEYIVRVSSAIYNLDVVSNDVNLPAQARTAIWNILSMLESIKTS